MTQEEMVELKKEIQEELEKLKIRLVNVTDLKVRYDYDSEQYLLGTVKENQDEDSWEKEFEESEEHRYLAAVKDMVRILETPQRAIEAIESYYDSSCY